MQSIVQDLAVHYTRMGRGKSVVILHGWGDSGASWTAFAHQLAKEYDVITPDLPGFGGSDAPQAAWGVTDYAQFVADFLHKIGVKPHAVIGHSNGGAIAVRGIGQGVIQTNTLILLASAGVRSPRSNQGYAVIAKVGKVVVAPLPKKMRSKLRQKLYQRAGSDMLVAEHLQETFKRVVRDDVRADAAYLSTPTLLIYGDRDTTTPVHLGEQLCDAIDGATLLVLPGAGHFVHQDAPTEVLAATKEMLGA